MLRSRRESHKNLKNVYRGEEYPELPLELKPYYYYYNDGKTGHVIMAIPSNLIHNAVETGDYYRFERPFPVRFVLAHGYETINGFLVCEAEYTNYNGLIIPKEWYEV